MFRYASLLRTTGLAALACVMLAGCGREQLASVTGVAMHNGQPVKGGTFIFSPVGGATPANPGKPASAVVKDDGSFTLGTYGKDDGALVGKHRVIYTPPQPELTDEQRSDPTYIATPSPYVGCAPKEMEIEIKPGKNQLQIELVSRS